MTDYTVAVVLQVLMIGVLVSVLLIGGFLLLNLGLLSKRETDLIGERSPSDVGLLKCSTWPMEHENRPVLPAQETEEGVGTAVMHDEELEPPKQVA